MIENISFIVAFGAGVLSFLSPCVIPLVPVYLAILYGSGTYERGAAGIRIPLFLHSLCFITGFSIIFITLGVVAGLTGYAINPNSAVLNKVAGIGLIAFGLFMIAALKVPWLNYEKRLAPRLGSTTGYLRSLLVGATFSLGWTACVGPILGGILALALAQATAWQGAYLLAVYSLGLGLPFLAMGVAFDLFMPLLRRIQRYSILISIVSGILLIAVGIIILTNNISWFLSLAG